MECIAMLVIDERATDRRDSQDAYFDGSLELLRELAVTNDIDAAWPRLSAILGKMLPHDAWRVAGGPHHTRSPAPAARRDRGQDAAARRLAYGVLRSHGATGRKRVDRGAA